MRFLGVLRWRRRRKCFFFHKETVSGELGLGGKCSDAESPAQGSALIKPKPQLRERLGSFGEVTLNEHRAAHLRFCQAARHVL